MGKFYIEPKGNNYGTHFSGELSFINELILLGTPISFINDEIEDYYNTEEELYDDENFYELDLFKIRT